MYWDAYLADTTHLTTEEHGAYMLLLAAMWRRNGSVPDDDKDNARILGLTPAKWRKIKARLMQTISGFRVDDGHITQEKLRKTWENTQEKIEKNRANGSKGGRAASSKNNDLGQANATETVKPKRSIPEPEPEPYREDTSVSSTRERPKRKSRISEDAEITDAMLKAAQKRGHSLQEAEAQFQKLKNDALAKGKAFVDWDRAFVTWLDSEYFKPVTTGGRHDQPSRTGAAADFAARAEERYAARRESRMDSREGDNAVVPLLSAGRADGVARSGH